MINQSYSCVENELHACFSLLIFRSKINDIHTRWSWEKENLQNHRQICLDTCLCNLYYLYKKFTRKLTELTALYEILSEMYEFSNNCIMAHCATRQIGVYMTQIKRVVRWEEKNDKATLQEKRGKLLEATTLFCAAFSDISEPTKMFSLLPQKKDTNILTITDILKDSRSEKSEKILANWQNFLWQKIFPIFSWFSFTELFNFLLT